MRTSTFYAVALFTAAAVSSHQLNAREKTKKTDSSQQDQIVVEAHITVGGGPITGFMATHHYSRSYVYAEREAGKPVTLIDVTNIKQPQVLSESAWGNLLAVAGTAALASDAAASTPEVQKAAARTIRIMDFSDPANPKITMQFDGVTAMEKIAGGAILLANADGIWILSQHLAEDPAVEKRYANKIVYGESMY